MLTAVGFSGWAMLPATLLLAALLATAAGGELPLRGWLQQAGVLDETMLARALADCKKEEIQSVSDLRVVHDEGDLHRAAFTTRTLSHIKRALGTDSRRRQQVGRPAMLPICRNARQKAARVCVCALAC